MAAARERTKAIPVPTGGAGATNVIYTLPARITEETDTDLFTF